jgi:hypothetical protein
MLASTLLTPLIPTFGEAVTTGTAACCSASALTRALKTADTLVVGSPPATSYLKVLAAADGATTMAVGSPPRSRIVHYPRSLTVPTAALASSKTRKRRSGGGSGGDGDEFGGDDGFFGGGDDGFGGSGGEGGGDGGAGGDDAMGRWLQDVVLLWTVFCAWSTYNVLSHVTRGGKQPPAPCLAAVTIAATAAAAVAP